MKHVIAILIALVALNAEAQQEPQYTQYMDNMLYYNPAYAGSREMLNVTALHRQQWVGFTGAPITTTLAVHSPLRYESVGLGLSVMNDKIGPTNATWINADMSYSLRFKRSKGRLSFGLKAGINLLNGDLGNLVKEEQVDPSLNVRYSNDVKPNIGGGVYYSSKQWFVGLSTPKIIETEMQPGEVLYLDRRHYYLMAGGYITCNSLLKLRPSAMLKVTENAPFALDGTLALIFYDRLWLGGNYRLKESAGGFVQYQINNQFKIGYAFDISTTKMVHYNFGSHELLLSYDLVLKGKSLTSPRYF